MLDGWIGLVSSELCPVPVSGESRQAKLRKKLRAQKKYDGCRFEDGEERKPVAVQQGQEKLDRKTDSGCGTGECGIVLLDENVRNRKKRGGVTARRFHGPKFVFTAEL